MGSDIVYVIYISYMYICINYIHDDQILLHTNVHENVF